MTTGKQLIVRLISSEDHAVSKEELLQTIKETGTDRYDTERKQIFDYFYGPHRVDFFGTIVETPELESSLQKLKDEFSAKAMGDRQKHVVPDIAIIYNTGRCDMVQHVYDGRLTSDCFRFIGAPIEALEEVREI